MNLLFSITIFLAFFGGVLAVDFKLTYNEECGNAAGVSRSKIENFNFAFENWDHDINCYLKCEHERRGYFADGKFTREFIYDMRIKSIKKEGIAYEAADSCLVDVDNQPRDECDKVGKFIKCVVVGQFVVPAFNQVENRS